MSGAGDSGKAAKAPGKAKKPPKPAKLFRKPIPEAAFRKKCLGLVEIEADRAFLESCFVLSDGARTLKGGLDRDAMVRLNKLGKAIAANRGVLKMGPLVLAGILAAAIAVFALFFMNPLLERSLERGLEAAFGARAEVSGFRLDLFGLDVSIRSIAVADREEPMTNLFETGRIELELDPASLLRGKVYVVEASAASISLGTPRKASGALPGAAPAPAAPARAAAASSSPPIVDFSKFDAKALLEREKSKLASLAAYEKAGAAYDEAVKRWKDRASDSKKSVSRLSSSSEKLLALDPKKIKSAPDAMKAVSDLKAIVDSAKSTAKEAGSVASGLRADFDSALALEKEAKAALDRDLGYLKSFVDFRSGAAASVLEPVLLGLLSDGTRKYFHYGERALETALALAKKPEGQKEAAKPKKGGLGKGRDVRFPELARPSFRLGHLGASFVQERATWTADIREISSDPSLVPSPSSLEATMVSGRESVDLKAVVDLRKEASRAFTVDALAKGYRLDLGKSFAAAGVGGFKGLASGKLEASGEAEGGFAASCRIDVGEAAASDVSGAIGAALAEGLSSVKSVKVDVGYEHPRHGDDKYSVRTNLDDIVAKALKSLAARYADKAVAEVKAALRDYAAKELEGKLGAKVDLDGLLSSSLSGGKSASAIAKALEDKTKALESRAKELGEKALGDVKAPAEVKAPGDVKAPKSVKPPKGVKAPKFP
jgi:uncharacterized protein (TIGR03545 family)